MFPQISSLEITPYEEFTDRQSNKRIFHMMSNFGNKVQKFLFDSNCWFYCSRNLTFKSQICLHTFILIV